MKYKGSPIPNWDGPPQHHPLYKRWSGMKQRCCNPKHIGWKNYGGLGVKVCERWHDFGLFVSDMGMPPSPLHTIDRIKPELGYEPGNCRWATAAEQNRNTSRNITATVDGITLTIRDWEIKNGVRRGCYQRRIDLGWPAEEAVTQPVQPGKHLKLRERE